MSVYSTKRNEDYQEQNKMSVEKNCTTYVSNKLNKISIVLKQLVKSWSSHHRVNLNGEVLTSKDDLDQRSLHIGTTIWALTQLCRMKFVYTLLYL